MKITVIFALFISSFPLMLMGMNNPFEANSPKSFEYFLDEVGQPLTPFQAQAPSSPAPLTHNLWGNQTPVTPAAAQGYHARLTAHEKMLRQKYDQEIDGEELAAVLEFAEPASPIHEQQETALVEHHSPILEQSRITSIMPTNYERSVAPQIPIVPKKRKQPVPAPKKSFTEQLLEKHRCPDPNCTFESQSIQTLVTHARNEHELRIGKIKHKKHRCPDPNCTFESQSIKRLVTHARNEHEFRIGNIEHKKHRCPDPNCTFESQSIQTLVTHARNEHELRIGKIEHKKHRCPDPNCNFQITLFQALVQHAYQEHQLKFDKESGVWGKKISKHCHPQTTPLEGNSNYKKLDVSFPCPNCKLSNGRINIPQLKDHILSTHINFIPFVCEHPGCTFQTIYCKSLKTHALIKHQSSYTASPETLKKVRDAINAHLTTLNWKYSCQACGEIFPSDASAQNHINTAHRSRSAHAILLQDRSTQSSAGRAILDSTVSENQSSLRSPVIPSTHEQDFDIELLTQILELESAPRASEIQKIPDGAEINRSPLQRIGAVDDNDLNADDFGDDVPQEESVQHMSENEELPHSAQEKAIEEVPNALSQGLLKRSLTLIASAEHESQNSETHLEKTALSSHIELDSDTSMHKKRKARVAPKQKDDYKKEVKPFPCGDCKPLGPITEFKNHILTAHTDLMPYKCHECSYKSDIRKNTYMHAKNTHQNIYTPSQETLKHVVRAVNAHLITLKWDLQCKECNELFGSDKNLQHHYTVAHNDGSKFVLYTPPVAAQTIPPVHILAALNLLRPMGAPSLVSVTPIPAYPFRVEEQRIFPQPQQPQSVAFVDQTAQIKSAQHAAAKRVKK